LVAVTVFPPFFFGGIAMNAETLRDFVRAQPFEPFRIRMSNGELHEIRHPECIMIGTNKAVVHYPDHDRFVFCALIHINTVEPLQTT
jgi:hypothetical protein